MQGRGYGSTRDMRRTCNAAGIPEPPPAGTVFRISDGEHSSAASTGMPAGTATGGRVRARKGQRRIDDGAAARPLASRAAQGVSRGAAAPGRPPNALLSLPDDRLLYLAAVLRDTPVPAPSLSLEEWRAFLDHLRPHGVFPLLAYRLRAWPEDCRPPSKRCGSWKGKPTTGVMGIMPTTFSRG